MQKLIEISMDNNTKLYIETTIPEISDDNDPLLVPTASGHRVVKKAKGFLESSFVQIKEFSNNIAKVIKSSEIQPDEFELEFAVKFGAEAGIIISSASTEANITVKMKWNKDGKASNT